MYAAIAAARAGQGQLKVALASPSTNLVLRPRLYQSPSPTMAPPLKPVLEAAGVAMIPADLVGRDGSTAVFSDRQNVTFGRIVIATGSRMRTPALPGVDLTQSIDDLPSAERFHEALRRLSSETPPAIAIVGAGFSGIELALEMRTRLAAIQDADWAAAAEVTLIDRHEEVGCDLGPHPRPYILEALRQERVVLRLGTVLAVIERERLRLVGGEAIRSDVTVLCTGLEARPTHHLAHGRRDELGRLVLDRKLQPIEGDTQTFVAGDAGVADTGDGHPTLMSCQHAMTTGRFAGENAARSLLGPDLIPYSQPRYVTCLDLGPGRAVLTEGWSRTIISTGVDAKAVKRRINEVHIAPPIGDRQSIFKASQIPIL